MTRDELWRKVIARVPQAREPDFVRAVGMIHERFGIACGWAARGYVHYWGLSLRKKIKTLPPGVLLVIGVKFTPNIQDILATLP